MRADRDPLIADIKRHNPTKIAVTLRDGETKMLPVSSKSNRWEKLLDTLSSIPWDSIECLNASNETLAIIEAEVDATETDERAAAKHAELRAMATVLLDVMKTTQKETARQYESQMSHFLELTQSVMRGLDAVQQSYSLAMKVQATAQATQALPDGSEMDIMKLLMMAQQMKPAAPPAEPKRMPMRPAAKPAPVAPPAHANGVAP